MSLTEFLVFVNLVCNMSAPSTLVSEAKKQECFTYYVNCAAKNVKIDRIEVSNCVLNKGKQK